MRSIGKRELNSDPRDSAHKPINRDLLITRHFHRERKPGERRHDTAVWRRMRKKDRPRRPQSLESRRSLTRGPGCPVLQGWFRNVAPRPARRHGAGRCDHASRARVPITPGWVDHVTPRQPGVKFTARLGPAHSRACLRAVWTQKSHFEKWLFYGMSGRGKRIRTSGPCVPNAVLYQAELFPDVLLHNNKLLLPKQSSHTKN